MTKIQALSFDHRQQQAINAIGKNIVVSASAGAGKTRVLVERLLKRCLQDQVPLNRILALTFTKAAAQEMKNRVGTKLLEKRNLAQLENNDQLLQYLDQQIVLLANAQITTIDSFCKTIIEKYYNVIGLDPVLSNNLIDDSYQNTLLLQAYQNALNQFDDQQVILLCNQISLRPEDEDSLFQVVKKTIQVVQASQNPMQWFETAHLQYTKVAGLNDFQKPIYQTFVSYFTIYYKKLSTILQQIEDLLNDPLQQDLPKKLDETKQVLALGRGLNRAVQPFDYDMFQSLWITLTQTTLPTAKNEIYKQYREEYYDLLEELAKILAPSSQFIEFHNQQLPILHDFIDLAKLTYQNFQNLKKEHQCMDFADIERFALDILTINDHAVSKLYQLQYDEIMVDEFQDTSILQNEIIEKIAKPNSIFRVGDVKQSIYRFRQAKPGLMRDLMSNPEIEHIGLIHNYRSKEHIVKFNNQLFQNLMNIEHTSDQYDENDTVTINLNIQQKTQDDEPVQFVFIQTSNEDEYGKKVYQAKWIADKMNQYITQGYHYKDMAVLLRSHNDKLLLKSIFDDYGISYQMDTRQGFYHSYLCTIILSILEYFFHPNNVVALTSILTSEIYHFDDLMLANLVIDHGNIQEGLQKQYPNIVKELQDLKQFAYQKGMIPFLNALSKFHDFYDQLDVHKQTNFDYLFDKALKAEHFDSHVSRLYQMMKDALDDEKSSEAHSTSKDQDVATITTIHQSKGLQYKIVFLFSTMENRLKNDMIPVDDTLFFGFPYIDIALGKKFNTLEKIAIDHKNNLEDIEEFNRILYVALTRAEEKMFIVDAGKQRPMKVEQLSVANLFARKGMSGLVLQALSDNDQFTIVDTTSTMVDHACNHKFSKQANPVRIQLTKFNETSLLPSFITPSKHDVATLPNLEQTSQSFGTGYGTQLHEVIASLPNRIWTQEDLISKQLSDTQMKHLLALTTSDMYQKLLSYDIHKEYPFYIETKSQRISGIIDFLAIKEDIYIVDFKTDHKTEEELKTLYYQQLLHYKQAIQLMYKNKPIHCYIYSLYLDQWIDLEMEDTHDPNGRL